MRKLDPARDIQDISKLLSVFKEYITKILCQEILLGDGENVPALDSLGAISKRHLYVYLVRAQVFLNT